MLLFFWGAGAIDLGFRVKGKVEKKINVFFFDYNGNSIIEFAFAL